MLYHRALALLVCVELADRWSVTQLLSSAHSVGTRALPPTPLLDDLEWRPVLLLAAAAAAAASLCGSRLARLVLLLLHVALSLRHPTFVWILDRYAQLLLLVSALLPSQPPSQLPSQQRRPPPRRVSSGVVALARLQVVWIYLDAAAVKLRSGAWWRAAPGRLSALDVYLRHTRGAAAVRALLPRGTDYDTLHLLSSATVALEVAAPLALLLACVCRWARPRRWLARGALVLLEP